MQTRLLLSLIPLLYACSEGPRAGALKDDPGGPAPTDVPAPDTPSGGGDVNDAGQDLLIAQDAGCPPLDLACPEPDGPPGEFAWPCWNNDDCDSGFCLESTQGFFCSQQCDSECPCGFECMIVGFGQCREPASLCWPAAAGLRRWSSRNEACDTDSDCLSDNCEAASGDDACHPGTCGLGIRQVGESCTRNPQCESDLCNTGVCSRPCTPECPEDQDCRALNAFSPDPLFICAPALDPALECQCFPDTPGCP